jgi:predicted GNAT family N-acyltransferase
VTGVHVEVRRVARPRDLEEVYRIRHDVFVVEQDVPLELERDADDETADHFLALVRADGATESRAAGAGRLVAEPGQVGHLGRLAVLPSYRGAGAGVALVRAIEERARARGLVKVVLGAQVHALGFYERLGYAAYGEVFDDAGIPHRHMRKDLLL